MTRLPLPAARVLAIRPPRMLPGRAPLSALGAAIALALGGVAFDAEALSLGRITVQSALGEPLRAEIDVTEISAAEAEGLRVNIGSPETFRTAGVPYNSALSDVRSTLQRRADGRYVVRLSSNRSVSDPFIDLVIEANWGSGRITRDYTVLLDPPSSRPSTAMAAIAPTPAQITPPAAAPLPVAPRPRPATAAVAVPPPPAPAPAEPAARAAAATGGGGQVTVRTGDTASKIAGAYKPAEVSLDQMLVALLRANPNAFINGNVNRVRAGAVLDLPSAAQATATPAAEARRTVIAQSRDFGDYRRRLADNAPGTQVASADRQATGKLQANVQDRNAIAASPDKLTIAQARAADDKLAQARQAQESNARLAELSKNISELNKLQNGGATTPAPAGTAAPAGAPAAATATSPAATPAPPTAAAATPAAGASGTLPAVVAPAALAAATAAPTAPATPPAAGASAASPQTPAAAAAPAAEPHFLDDLLSNPLMLGGGALILLLLAFLAYRLTQSRRRDAGESVFLESRLPKDSFFAASGGESVDTKNRNSVVSSLSYSPSQLDTGDVDPVAEADVYLAYGRDLQAEEILREALRINPERVAIHLKLLEIHAKRRDLRAYEALAADVHKLTGGTGSDWNRVVDMGKELDPGNPLYEAGVRPVAEAALPVAAVAVAAAALTPPPPPPPVAVPPPPAFVSSVAPLDFDLDLQTPDAYPTTMTAPITEQPAIQANLPHPTSPAPTRFGRTPQEAPPALPAEHDASNDFDTDFNTAPGALETPGLSLSLPVDEHTRPAPLRAEPKDDSGFIEFDMSALSGLNGRDSGPTEPGRLEALDEGADNPHAIKLSLARELQALGDTEGARSLVEEVEAESVGDLKTQARQLLAEWA
nr:FimV/HubP family polar landmark protein [Variovorax sp. J22G40]